MRNANVQRLVVVCFGIAFLLPLNVAAQLPNFYVVNQDNNTIYRFNETTKPQTYFADSNLSDPAGVVLHDGYLYVANQIGGTIYKFNSSGEGTPFVTGLSYPGGLAIGNDGHLYVANQTGPSIYEYEFGAPGSGTEFAGVTDGLDNPIGLAFDGGGNLFVANYGDNRILKFNPSGGVSVFATGLSGPAGLAFDDNGYLYVANQTAGTIDKFDPLGGRTQFASMGVNSNPTGLAFDSNTNLYVANSGSNTIVKIDASGNWVVFADTHLSGPQFLVVTELPLVPEPATGSLLTWGLATFFLRRRGRG
ncbi:MAG: NHL repeat-containing protein [Verrucomicrobia bacterium]|nr:NHL repeat-containing protein [Verrucomicrobiota bacterium]